MKYIEIGKRIKSARMSAGLSQKELAIKLSLSPSLINNFEKGKRKPELIDAFRLELLLGIKDGSISQLCIGADYRSAAQSLGLRPFNRLFLKPGVGVERDGVGVETKSQLELGSEAKMISVPVNLPKNLYLKLEFQ